MKLKRKEIKKGTKLKRNEFKRNEIELKQKQNVIT